MIINTFAIEYKYSIVSKNNTLFQTHFLIRAKATKMSLIFWLVELKPKTLI